MRFYAKFLAALLAAVVMQSLISAGGGWEEFTFYAKCLVLDWRGDPVVLEKLVVEAQRMLAVERDAAESAPELPPPTANTAARRGSRPCSTKESPPPSTSRP